MTMSQKGRALPVSDDECLIMLDATPGDVGHGQRLLVRMGRQAPYGERVWDKSAGPVVFSRYQAPALRPLAPRLNRLGWTPCLGPLACMLRGEI
jgi:hypothetical protein